MQKFLLYILLSLSFLALGQQSKKKYPPSKKRKTTQSTYKKKPTQSKTNGNKSTKTNSGKLNNDINKINTPKINQPPTHTTQKDSKLTMTNPDTSQIEEVPNFGVDGTPHNELTEVSEDTSDIGDFLGETEIVETEEQIKIDSQWVKVAEEFEYMDNWNPKRVNPYNFNPDTMPKTPILVIDSANGRFWSKPLKRCLKTSDFGERWGRWHYGVDLGLTTGDSVVSVFDGLIRVVGFDRRGYGNFIVVRHYNGLETLYGHMSRTYAKIGDYVKAGDLIGFGGSTGRSTGPHLHFEIRYAGQAIDPKYFFAFEDCELIKKSCFLSAENFKYQKVVRKIYYHKVKSGDNLGKIARKYHVTVKQLCRINKISAKTPLKIGRRLRIR